MLYPPNPGPFRARSHGHPQQRSSSWGSSKQGRNHPAAGSCCLRGARCALRERSSTRARLQPHLTARVRPFLIRPGCRRAAWAARRHLHPERGRGRRAAAAAVPSIPLLLRPAGSPRQPPPRRLPAHHAGYFHPDVLRHRRPGDPLLHHLHALERCWGRGGSAPAWGAAHGAGETSATHPLIPGEGRGWGGRRRVL